MHTHSNLMEDLKQQLIEANDIIDELNSIIAKNELLASNYVKELEQQNIRLARLWKNQTPYPGILNNHSP
jgi:hypothetical protein